MIPVDLGNLRYFHMLLTMWPIGQAFFMACLIFYPNIPSLVVFDVRACGFFGVDQLHQQHCNSIVFTLSDPLKPMSKFRCFLLRCDGLTWVRLL